MMEFKSCEKTRGRMNSPVSCSNGENMVLPEFESFETSLSGVFEAKPRTTTSTEANLTVQNINMYEKKNKLLHYTDVFNHSNLIIRRGQKFTIGIVFSRPFNLENDQAFVEFLIGSNPTQNQKTLISLTLSKNSQNNNWDLRMGETIDNETKLVITPAADCIVGYYSTYVSIVTDLGKVRSRKNRKTDFYVLFNPWAPADQVYLNDEVKRKEYVLNDVGMIFTGDYNNINTRPWIYGQFQSGILEACIFILDFGKMPLQYRGDAIKVVRKVSAMINSLDDNGVIVGSWADDFSNGTSPSAWTGSVEILRKYFSEGGKPVKYGQCWVYAGVFNTFLRCLGLPARVITNYCSAHDNSGNLITDIVLDEDGNLDKDVSDSIWNYHCWNEVFLKRRDMPDNLSGWQVVDSTPQEISEGYYRCGPTSVMAIKTGSLNYSFDAGFVYAEVNSDVVFQKRDKYGNMSVISVNSDYIGRLIVTKAIGSNDYDEITSSYKHIKTVSRRETKTEEQEVTALDGYHCTLPDTDVKLSIQVTKTTDELILTLTFNNLSNELRTITTKITGKVEYYTGVTRTQFMFRTLEVSLKPLEGKQEVITVTANEYKSFIIGQSFLSFLVFAHIKETAMSLTAIEPIYLGNPTLLLEVNRNPQIKDEMLATVSFTNTLGYDLTNVTVRMEGINLLPLKNKTYSVIEHGSKIKWIESFKPQKEGTKTLVACLDCATLRDVCGHLQVVIQPWDN